MLTNPAAMTPAAETDTDRTAPRIAARETPVAEDTLPKTAVRTTHRVSVAQLDVEAARMRAESERDELRRRYQEQVAAAESEAEELRASIAALKAELAQARQQLEAAIAERTKLANTFQLVQRALAFHPLGNNVDASKAAGGDASIRVQGAAQQRPAAGSAARPPAKAPTRITEAQSVLIGAPIEAVEDVGRVLAYVESVYLQDQESGRSGIELADRLTASLRHARSIIVGRWSIDGFDAQTLFEYHMGLLLDRQVGTSFGRHLGIAAYASRTPDPATPREPGNNAGA